MTDAQREELARIEETREAYRAANQRCELRDLLDLFDPPGWKPFRTAVYTGRKPFELHHILGKEFKGCEAHWNYLMVSPGAHDFCTGAMSVVRYGDGAVKAAGTSKVGRALCLLAKEAKREIDFAAAGKTPGFYPLGALAIEAANGFYGCDRITEAITELIGRWSPHLLSGPTCLGPDVTC